MYIALVLAVVETAVQGSYGQGKSGNFEESGKIRESQRKQG